MSPYEYAHDLDTPVHPVSAPDYMPVEELRALQLHRLQGLVRRVYDHVPLTRARMEERGVRPEHIQTLRDIALLPFMMKTDLRDTYPFGLFASPMNDIVRFHCSSGTTGKPIVIGNTQNDIRVWQNGCMRALALCGVRSSDIMQVAYGYGLFTGGLGLHYGGEGLGCAVLPISGGNTDRQLMLMRDMGVTVIACTPSYFLHLIDEGMKKGIDFRRDMQIRHGVFGAEPWTEEMRAKIESLTGITAHDIYGLTEIAGPGVANDCRCRRGLHVFEDHFYPEIVDTETLEPLPDGEQGELVFTTLTRTGTPMLRYRTRDLSRLLTGACPCGRTIRAIERIRARSDDMLIIRGVNVFPSQIEAGLLSIDSVLPHYQIVVDKEGDLDTLEIKVEVTRETFSDDIKTLERLRQRIGQAVQRIINLSAHITLVEPHTLPRSEGKLQRVTDLRNRAVSAKGSAV
ncbi:MAG: phenylacetate--CoA ligase [Kiritimatiellia bacterium]|jgi:phenylacetate-CoA ligase|nr:phenylacetate--CoA ligase [Kiritimatiellia bacterium]